jgi:diguanylate cyclase (GGDEF)-like protein/PAS domain S-box-containing protein
MEPDFEQALSLLRDVVIVTEATPLRGDGPRIVYVNEAFSRLTGYGAGDVVGRGAGVLHGPATDRATLARMRAGLERGEPVNEVVLNYTRDGTPRWMDLSVKPMRDRNGRVSHLLAIERDISAHQAIERRVQDAATRDPLTGLAGRQAFLADAGRAHAQAQADGRDFALLVLDIDHFRSINATHGHAIGDELLQQLAEAIREPLRGGDVTGRLSGDEFGVALLGVAPGDGEAIALRVRAAIRRMRLPGLPWLGVTVSMGMACAEGGDDPLSLLLARAERACDESRRAGRNRLTVDRIFGKVIPFRPRRPPPVATGLLDSPLHAE